MKQKIKQTDETEELLEEQRREEEAEQASASTSASPRTSNASVAAVANRARANTRESETAVSQGNESGSQREQSPIPEQPAKVRLNAPTEAELTGIQITEAISYNQSLGYPTEAWEQIAQLVGALAPDINENMVQCIARYQIRNGLAVSGKVSPGTRASLCAAPGGEGLRALLSIDDDPDTSSADASDSTAQAPG